MLQCWGFQFSLPCGCPSCFHCSNLTPINTTDVLFLVFFYLIFKVQDFLTLFSLHHCFPAPPWTAHLQPPISFTSRKAEAVFACSPDPCFSYETRTEMLWNFYFSSPAVQSGNTEQKEAFVFVVWFLKRNMNSSPQGNNFSKKENPNKVILEG